MAIGMDLGWWITAVEIPALAGMFWLIWRQGKDYEAELNKLDDRVDMGLAQWREALAAYKLEVAKTYATTGTLREVERRLTEHLVRIEAKLDAAQGIGGR